MKIGEGYSFHGNNLQLMRSYTMSKHNQWAQTAALHLTGELARIRSVIQEGMTQNAVVAVLGPVQSLDAGGTALFFKVPKLPAPPAWSLSEDDLAVACHVGLAKKGKTSKISGAVTLEWNCADPDLELGEDDINAVIDAIDQLLQPTLGKGRTTSKKKAALREITFDGPDGYVTELRGGISWGAAQLCLIQRRAT
jgi:hypothetical protein